MKALVEKLKATAKETNATDIRGAFAADPNRFKTFSTSLDDFLFDYSICAPSILETKCRRGPS